MGTKIRIRTGSLTRLKPSLSSCHFLSPLQLSYPTCIKGHNALKCIFLFPFHNMCLSFLCVFPTSCQGNTISSSHLKKKCVYVLFLLLFLSSVQNSRLINPVQSVVDWLSVSGLHTCHPHPGWLSQRKSSPGFCLGNTIHMLSPNLAYVTASLFNITVWPGKPSTTFLRSRCN